MVSIMAVIIEVCNIKIQMQISYFYIIFLLQLFLQTFMYSVRSWHEADGLAREHQQESYLLVGSDLFKKTTIRSNYESISFTIASASYHVVFSSMCFLISTRFDIIIDGQRFFQERYACQEYPI